MHLHSLFFSTWEVFSYFRWRFFCKSGILIPTSVSLIARNSLSESIETVPFENLFSLFTSLLFNQLTFPFHGIGNGSELNRILFLSQQYSVELVCALPKGFIHRKKQEEFSHTRTFKSFSGTGFRENLFSRRKYFLRSFSYLKLIDL